MHLDARGPSARSGEQRRRPAVAVAAEEETLRRRQSVAKRPRPRRRQQLLRRGLNNELNHPPNFERLVLFCIEAKFCNQILIGKHFSRSTRFAILCTAQISKFRLKIVKFFAKLNIEYSIEIAHFQYEKCYFSSKWR